MSMLKPKKKLTRRQLKRDPLLDTLANTRQIMEQNRQKIMRWGGGLLVALLLLWGWRYSAAQSEAEAMAAATKALDAYFAGVNANVIAELENVVTNYGDKEGAQDALFYLAQTRIDSGQYDEATQLLERLRDDTDDPDLKCAALLKLAYLKELNKDFAAAGDLYLEAAKVTHPEMRLRAALWAALDYHRAGRLAEACEQLRKILDNKPPRDVRQLAEFYASQCPSE